MLKKYLIIKEFADNSGAADMEKKHRDIRALRVETMRYTSPSINPRKKIKPTVFDSLDEVKAFVSDNKMNRKKLGYAEITKNPGEMEFWKMHLNYFERRS